MRALLLLLALVALGPAEAQAAPTPPRPYSGLGVLALHPAPEGERTPIPVYQEPGLQRIAEPELGALPRLAGDARQPIVAVHATRGGWLRLAYDDAGREGWLQPSRGWQYRPWEEYLPGRLVRVLPGMKKTLYLLKGEPREAGPEVGVLARDQQVRVVRVAEDWALLQAPAGWFRWRDGDGRLTVSP